MSARRRGAGGVAVVALVVGLVMPARAGHELAFYPSFYPQEITIETVAPPVAARRLTDTTLHAYVGDDPFPAAARPTDVAAVESFGSYVVLRVEPAVVPDRAARCALADEVRTRLATVAPEVVVHPYPVTPYHGDYLGHLDRAEAARARSGVRPRDGAPSALALDARGPLAQALVARLDAGGAGRPAVAVLEQLDLDALAAHPVAVNGWLGPPWAKHGWYHAYQLAAPVVSDPDTRRRVDALYARRVTGAYRGEAERLELERALVSALTSGCERAVLGYTVARASASTEYTKGVENIGADSHEGLASALFVRTVKLKDFPWNGWLHIGTPTAPRAAWNPAGGFTDAPGRLVWAALGDPAFLPAPRGATWLPNRTSAVLEAPRGGLAVPGNARRPTPGTGALTPVDGGRRAGAKVTYRVRFGAFHDGARMSVADVLYAIGQPYRWAGPAEDGRHDATLAATTALLRERLVALRVTKIATEVRRDSDVEFVYDVPTIEVYLDRAPSEPLEAALVAPPWTTVPWHVAALMDEAARRGIAALSEAEATRRRVPWLDLVRDREVHAALAALVETFAREGFVPASLRGEVSVEEARTRWAALARFAGRHGHFLVTNGPYRLDRWSDDAVVLTVFRDLSYPLGVGHFDEYTIPLRAWVTRVEDRGDRLELSAEVETVSKFARSYEIVRAPLRAGSAGQLEHLPVCRYVVIGPAGSVVRAGRAPLDARRVFRVDLRGLRPGRYAVLTVLEIDGNAVGAPVRSIEHHVRRR